METLPFILLGLQTTFKEDLKGLVAEFVYGQSLTLPGELVASTPATKPSELQSLVERVMLHCNKLQPLPPSSHTPLHTYVPKALDTCKFVFLHDDTVKAPLQPPYTGLYRVVKQTSNTMDIIIKGSVTTVSLSRAKPAHVKFSPTSPTIEETTLSGHPRPSSSAHDLSKLTPTPALSMSPHLFPEFSTSQLP
ncbi:uncharacterized protein LOC124579730 [Schistocerca americana]|uniref:uncharacterized protein LOC124579730 n=1 Tax=Schistocerca americana TaxID=7009 RepID=UPI001F4FF989|nr:uncharacterized protein LOC124579730 [Schistocerca americana]